MLDPHSISARPETAGSRRVWVSVSNLYSLVSLICFSRPSRGCAETTYGMVTNASTVRISVPCCDLHAPKPGVPFVARRCQP